MAGRNILKSGGLAALAAMLATTVAPTVSTAQENRGGFRGGERAAQAGGGEQRSAPAWRGRGGDAAPRARAESAPRIQQTSPVIRQQGGGEGRWQRRGDANQPRAAWQGGGDRARTDARQSEAVGPWTARTQQRAAGAQQVQRDGDRQWRDRDDRRQPAWRGDNNRRDNDRRWDRGDNRRWNNDWRRDRRYDWSSYRNSNRNVYRLGRYYSPYRNYYYRPLSVGFYLDSLFFGSRYWINDPWQYRLPPAYGDYRWVRYYDDVLLVDIYTGEVVDVIRNFFW
ncbi:MAG TPA: RcnB family protein [Novosphingobium sp.]